MTSATWPGDLAVRTEDVAAATNARWRLVRATRIGSSFHHDTFRASVLRFFIANPLLDTVHYGPIVDFIQRQKYEPIEVFVRPGVVETRRSH